MRPVHALTTNPLTGVSPAEVLITLAVVIFALNILVGGLIVRAWLLERRHHRTAADPVVTRSAHESASGSAAGRSARRSP
jgi:hypothetical protein